MKINSITNIFFQKKLVAMGMVGEPNSQKQVNFYRLELPQDNGYYTKCATSEDWKGNFYIKDIESIIVRGNKEKLDYYVMEDNEGRTLCYSALKHKKKEERLEYLEVMPKISSYNPDRKIKYVGETMVAFLTSIAKKRHKDFFVSEVAPREKTRNFYYKLCQMQKVGIGAFLPKEEIPELISQNRMHTGSSIVID